MLVFVGIGLAVFRDYFDERIYTEQDLEKITTVSVIGHINMKSNRKRNLQRLINNHLYIEVNMSMFRTKKQLPFDLHDDLMKEQFYTVYHELRKSGKQLFTVSSTKDRGVVASLIVNMGLVFAEMKKKVLLIDVNFSDPKLHVLLQSDHMITVNDIISSFPAIMNLF